VTNIANLNRKDRSISWLYLGQTVSVECPYWVVDTYLLSGDGVAVMSAAAAGAPIASDAVFLNGDGTLRLRLINPYPPEMRASFYRWEAEPEGLCAVLGTKEGDYRFTVDEHTGVLSNPRETR